jgi:hypothetical protein
LYGTQTLRLAANGRSPKPIVHVELTTRWRRAPRIFIAVIGIGLYKGRGDKTKEDFAVANRNIPMVGSAGVNPCGGDHRRNVPRCSRRGICLAQL